MAAITTCNDYGAPQNKVSHCFHCFSIYLPEVMGPDAVILVFWKLGFKPVFSLSSFTFIKKLFSSSLLSAIRVVSSTYLRLLIFLLEILIPVCASSSLAFHMMYSAYKLNKQGDGIQPWHIPFPVWNQSVVPGPVLTVVSWPAYRFLRRQVRWSGIPISLRIYQFIVIHSIVWPQVNGRKGTQFNPSTENWIKDLLSMALPTRARPWFPHSQSRPSGSFYKPLILILQRADRLKTTIREN